jgi:hypothetical protein
MIAPLVRILLRKTVILDAGWPLIDGVLSRGVKFSNLHRLASIFFVDFLAFHTSNLVLLESEAQLKRCRRIFLLSNRKHSVQYTGLDESKFNVLESKSQLVQDLEVKISSINNPLTVIFRGKVNKESGFTKILETAAKMPKEATFLFLLGLEDQYSNAPDNVLIVKGFTDSEMRYLYEISDIAIGQSNMETDMKLMKLDIEQFKSNLFLENFKRYFTIKLTIAQSPKQTYDTHTHPR